MYSYKKKEYLLNLIFLYIFVAGNDTPKTKFGVCGIYPDTKQQKQGKYCHEPPSNKLFWQAQIIKKPINLAQP